MQALVGELWSAHRPAVLLVTHDVDEALLLADRVMVLREGKIAVDRHVDLPRPRRHADANFNRMRVDLLESLGVRAD
jgi:sulfonate transport system ATP-binding protein